MEHEVSNRINLLSTAPLYERMRAQVLRETPEAKHIKVEVNKKGFAQVSYCVQRKGWRKPKEDKHEFRVWL